MFTPCRVARGPAHPDLLQSLRRTVGIDINGDQFVVVDDWRSPECAHRVRELPWTGVTTFIAKEKEEPKIKPAIKRRVSWSDEPVEQEEDDRKGQKSGEGPTELWGST